ncbi:aminotransferase class I/II-fold pyridoxal phosphate-dependent enzyme [Candidatus Saccharibacteria bacterium]|nr:aminotransferase class I/II-fold pyridoxal phosphate-dependent enzyme [Candidatus Saccharibacteria bacterium]
MKHYFIGMAAEYSSGEWLRHLFTFGRKKDCDTLTRTLNRRYGGETFLCKNGRSALTLALKAYFEPEDEILVNGFTCYAVYEAVKAAGLKPVFVDIDKKNLNFTSDTIEDAIVSRSKRAKGIIVQNTLGIPVDIKSIEKIAKEHDLFIIEDLAHCAGVKYKDGREAGTVGIATALSFGKDKSIDTVSGGAVIFRQEQKHGIKAPSKAPKPSDYLRAKFYPMFGALCRTLTYVGLGGAMMRLLVAIHFVEKSADNRLDITRRLNKFEAKRALKQINELRRSGESAIRDYCFVRDRQEVLKKLQRKGYYFGGLWYEKPVSPERYYNKVHFPEQDCPNAVYVSEHIINLPLYYTKRDLDPALKIIKPYLEKGEE